MTLAELVKAKRERLGISQKQFAELAGLGEVGKRTVRGWENNEHAPTPTALKRLEKIPENPPFKRPATKPKFRFVDLFAGIGGIRLPFQKGGGACVLTLEWDQISKKK